MRRNRREFADQSSRLPYFDFLLDGLKQGDKEIETSFGRHVHWGYWENPRESKDTAKDFAGAAEELSRQLCWAAEMGDELSVLDVGCGFGGTLAYLNENHSGMELTGLNLDEQQLSRARALVKSSNDNAVSFVQGNACGLPFSARVST